MPVIIMNMWNLPKTDKGINDLFQKKDTIGMLQMQHRKLIIYTTGHILKVILMYKLWSKSKFLV